MEREGYVIRDEYLPHFLTFRVIGGIDIFTRNVNREIVLQSLQHCRLQLGLKIYGYVIMSNHIHAILQHPEGKLSKTITSFKKFTGSELIHSISTSEEPRAGWMLKLFKIAKIKQGGKGEHVLWRTNNYAKFITTRKFFLQKLNYIHDNPVRAKIVEQPEHYIYSSASNYSSKKSLIEIDFWDGAILYK